MFLDDLNSIFIHIPKTGGNFLTKNFFYKFSKDQMFIKGHQDGINRFEVKGELTFKKHMSVKEYSNQIDLRNYYIIASCRDPLERLISFYFSPHRRMEYNLRAKAIKFAGRILKIDIKIGANGFKQGIWYFSAPNFGYLMKNTMTHNEYLEGYEKARGLLLIRQEHLEKDVEKLFSFLGVTPPLSASEFDKSNKINVSYKNINYKNKEIARELLRKSKHIDDYKYLEKIKEHALNL